MDPIKVADQVWIATALLHRELPEAQDFRIEEVLGRAAKEFGRLQPGVQVHLSSHAVATAKPAPGKYRLLTRTERGRIRLFRPGDPVHPDRAGKSAPRSEDIPAQYHPLLSWYREQYCSPAPKDAQATVKDGDPRRLMRFIGLITSFDLQHMKRTIAEECEHVEEQNEDDKDVA